MKIQYRNPYEFEENISIVELLERFNYKKNSISVAVNTDFISRGEYSLTIIKDNDKIEIVSPMQGG